ncbi:MAG: hypothetical protein L6R39_003418 [Caloplaca ligustica]|nr:MAG: hypothetical protein L6R39_003418 [Caloplaca ligustica]
MAADQPEYALAWLKRDVKGESAFGEETSFIEMPGAKKSSCREQPARQKSHVAGKVTTSSQLAPKTVKTAWGPTKRSHADRLAKLPAELILKILERTTPRDLRRLRLVNKRIRKIAMSNEKAIHIGIQRQQYSEYYQLFGTADRMSPDQEYHTMVEAENRAWWREEENVWFGLANGSQPRPGDKQFAPGDVGRVALYMSLAEDMEDTRTALDADQTLFGPESTDLTGKALMLFWKMQWNDRPGLEHLCERTETEEMYINIRQKLFAAEAPEVRTRYMDILKRVATGLWKRLELWDFTRAWSYDNASVIQSQRHINIKDLESWLRGLAAELMVEVISKVGIRRALLVDHVARCGWETRHIDGKICDRLEVMLRETASVLSIQTPPGVFLFGRAIGLQPDDIITRTESMLSG